MENMFSKGQGGVGQMGENERTDVCVLHGTKRAQRKQSFVK